MGNITGTFFLNSIADSTGLKLMPTPPTVMVDMAGAIIDAALADIMEDRDELFVMETVFSTDGQEVNGTLLVLPTADLVFWGKLPMQSPFWSVKPFLLTFC